MSSKFIFLFLLLSFPALYHSLPLSTSSRWIIDDSTGSRVKLRCINWAGHMEAMLPEGLDKRPVTDIARHVAAMGFNCVRLTYAAYMFTRFSNISVGQNLANLGLTDALAGLIDYNPGYFNITVVEAQSCVIDELGAQGVMVLLDNQVSKPQWCCNDNDGNGFFGDQFFDTDEWLHSLALVGKKYRDTPTVIAMSLRNELRGPLQNETIWHKNMPRAANIIHKSNPNVLILVSGLSYDLTFAFLKQKPFKVNIKYKIVYESHRYAWSAGIKSCEKTLKEIQNNMGFLIDGKDRSPTPLFVTEFGVNQLSNTTINTNFMSCFTSYLADSDLDWALWALQASYYIRSGKADFQETFGILETNWNSLKNPVLHSKLQLIQQQIRDPYSMGPSYYIMYHPWTRHCIKANDNNKQVSAGDCLSVSRWNHNGNGNPIRLKGTDLCISAAGDGLPVTLSTNCTTAQSSFGYVPGAEFQLASKDVDGTLLCLHSDPDYSTKVMTKKCACSGDSASSTCQDNSQWFKLISANVQ